MVSIFAGLREGVVSSAGALIFGDAGGESVVGERGGAPHWDMKERTETCNRASQRWCFRSRV